MSSYIINFTVYTMAMLGMIFFAVFVYKKVMNGSIYKSGSKTLSIEERMSINPRKSLLIVKAGEERFLVASDMERTSLISKLENPHQKTEKHIHSQKNEEIKEEPITTKQEIPVFIPKKEEPASESNNVHFEPIREKNPMAADLRRGMDRREPYKSHIQVTNIVPQYSNRIRKTTSTMKEMAARINKL